MHYLIRRNTRYTKENIKSSNVSHSMLVCGEHVSFWDTRLRMHNFFRYPPRPRPLRECDPLHDVWSLSLLSMLTVSAAAAAVLN